MTHLSIHFIPLVPWPILLGLCFAALIVVAVALRAGAKGTYMRAAALALVLLVLANPSVLKEERSPIKDKILVITDTSPSQDIGERPALVSAANDRLREELTKFPDIEPVFVNVEAQEDETRLWSVVQDAVGEMEEDALSGVILVTDGQVHDMPEDDVLPDILKKAPIHTVLTGADDEKDISVLITQTPRYALVDDDITITVRVDAHGTTDKINNNLTLAVMQDGVAKGVYDVQPGVERDIEFTLEHAGDTVFSFSVPKIEGELTVVNNTAVSIVKSIRDRLRVMLISGKPHAGERTWRNLLKSDPAVDLVHFTILRSPKAMDPTPAHELSLIAFPVHELFQRKIGHFDLIIFDRYHMQGVMQKFYLNNIRKFLVEGGGLLIASGAEYASKKSLYNTWLKDILPVRPHQGENSVIERGFVPKRTDLGEVHPVTERLTNRQRKWGRWFRQVGGEIIPEDARLLMTGADDLPLLVLDDVEKGRIAWLGSDHTWLWSRGLEHGGPQKELLRRLAHWLMKEPDLEENRLVVSVNDRDMTVRRRALLDVNDDIELSMFTPDQEEKTVMLKREERRRWQRADIRAESYGLYRFEDKAAKQTAFAIVGKIDIPELQQVIATEKNLSPLTSQTKGGHIWFRETDQDFSLRHKGTFGMKMSGDDWLGIKKNDAYRVTGLKNYPLLPPLFAMFLITAMIMLAWMREGWTKK